MTTTIESLGTFETSWCPGCGNHDIMKALRQAIVGLGLEAHKVAHVSGIGQAAKAPHYIRLNGFNGLHGRSLPPAQAIRLCNSELTVIAQSGDGCNYGEGGNHFLAAIRRNVDMTLLVHDNQIYGLTKGQASPTTGEGQVTKSQPGGVTSAPFNPVAVAVAMRCGFVARSFSGNVEHLQAMIEAAVRHRGFSLVDIFSPCVSFTKGNNVAVQMPAKPLQKLFEEVGRTTVFQLEIEEEGKKSTHPVLIWDALFHPYKKKFTHIDFFGVDLDREIKIRVPLEFVGTSRGVKLGGKLEVYREFIDVMSKPLTLPKKITLDLTELDINSTIMLKDVAMPEGVRPATNENFAILSVLTPKSE